MKLKLFFGLVLFTFVSLTATKIWIPYHFSTIQEGINAASNGDTVMVANGVYSGVGNTNLVFYGKSINLMSKDGPADTYINGAHLTRCVNFIYGEDNDTIIQGFTIENGADSLYAGGIHCENSSPYIYNNVIYNCSGKVNGGGLSIVSGDPVVVANDFTNNQAGEESGSKDIALGGAIAISDGSNPLIYYNIMINNYADIAGAISVSSTSGANLVNNTIANNLSNISSGGIVAMSNSIVNVRNCILWGNVGFTNQQLAIFTGSSFDVIYSDVEYSLTGIGNIDIDPQFINPTAGAGTTYLTFNSNWNLEPSSPCIDQGNPSDDPDEDGSVRDMGIFYYFHEAKFSFDNSFGYQPLTVQFTDTSNCEASNWYWDFDSDGTWDSFEQNPSHSYTDQGVYTVTFKTSNNAWESEIIVDTLIVVQGVLLTAPQNVTIAIVERKMHISWDEVDGANYYLLYASGKPDGIFTYYDFTADTSIISDDISQHNMGFVKIIGYDGTLESLQNYLIHHNQIAK